MTSRTSIHKFGQLYYAVLSKNGGEYSKWLDILPKSFIIK